MLVFSISFLTRNAVFIRGPLSQIDQTASLRAKGPKGIILPERLLFAYRAGNLQVCHFGTLSIRRSLHFSIYAIGTSTQPLTVDKGAAR
jgi:hypothetical protein